MNKVIEALEMLNAGHVTEAKVLLTQEVAQYEAWLADAEEDWSLARELNRTMQQVEAIAW
jgi:hypothetical protein